MLALTIGVIGCALHLLTRLLKCSVNGCKTKQVAIFARIFPFIAGLRT